MKKSLLICFTIFVFLLTGCSIKEDIPTIENSTIDYQNLNIDDYVLLNEYKHIIDSPDFSVSEEEIKEQEQYYLESYSTKQNENNSIKNGDFVNVHYSIKTDDAEETYTDENIIIGDESIAPGVDSNIIGKKAGDIISLTTYFPDDYKEQEFAGKNATINITINFVNNTEYSELTDSIIEKLTNNEYLSVKEFEEKIKNDIITDKKQQYYSELLQKIVENADFKDNIKDLVNIEYQNTIEELLNNTDDSSLNTDDNSTIKMIAEQYCEYEIKQKLVVYKFSKEFDIQYDSYDELYSTIMERLVEFQK